MTAPDTPHQPPEARHSAPPLRVGLMGWGGASQVFHAPLIRHTTGLQLVALSTSRPDAARAALGPTVDLHPDPASLLARGDLDLVVIPTPNDTHHPLALAALRAGCAVLVDKPFALDEAQGRELVDEADRRGLLLSVFHNRRWDADFLTARALLRSGVLGTVRQARLRFDRFRPVVRARWREGDGPGAGLWMDLGPHLLDQALQLFGRPQAIGADLWVERPGGVGVDAFTARLRWADGLRVEVAASMLAAQPGPRFELLGSCGSWVKLGLDSQEDALKAGRVPGDGRPWGVDLAPGCLMARPPGAAPGAEPVRQAPPEHAGDYPAFYASLRDAVRGQGPNPVPAGPVLDVMRLLDLGRQSAQERRELPTGWNAPATMSG
jgi:predicted dehydrogenase